MTYIENKTILFPSFKLANFAMKMAAKSADRSIDETDGIISPTLGIGYSTPASYVESQWELWGDGRKLIDDDRRLVLVLGLLSECNLEVSIGTASQISNLLKAGYANLAKFDVQDECELSAAERSLIRLTKRYSAVLDRWGYAELTEALDAIREFVSPSSVQIDSRCILDEPLKSFFAKCDRVDYSISDEGLIEYRVSGEDAIFDIDSDVDMSFLRAEGTSAVETMIFDECLRAISQSGFSRIAVIGADPAFQFDALSQDLCDMGYSCTRICSQRFSNTFFGRFFLSVCRLLALSRKYDLDRFIEVDSLDWISVASDIALSPYAAISPFDAGSLPSKGAEAWKEKLSAADFNTVLRSNRTLLVEDAVEDLHVISSSFARIESLFSGQGDPFASIGALEAIARVAFSEQDSPNEVDAIKCAIGVMETLADFDMPPYYVPIIVQIMATTAVETLSSDPSKKGVKESQKPEIAFISINAAANMPPSSFDEVIFSDVSDGFLNAKSKIDSTRELAKRFDISTSDSTMQRARVSFFASSKIAKHRFVCVFPAHDAGSSENFTSFCFDEFVEKAFGQDLTSKDIVKGDIPSNGRSSNDLEFKSLGEEGMQRGIGHIMQEPKAIDFQKVADRGELKNLILLDYMRHSVDDSGSSLPVISPSAIEKYLGCPYKWFIENMVAPSSIDEEFSSLERGIFAHELLYRFYGSNYLGQFRFLSNEDSSRSLYEAYENLSMELLEEQRGLSPNSGRYVPISMFEADGAAKLIEGIYECIKKMDCLPKRFDEQALEYSISPFSENPRHVRYGGFFINGKIDRVEVSADDGSFYILDYKGGVRSYDAGENRFSLDDSGAHLQIDPNSLPEHVQTLIYASILAKEGQFGNRCEGAFYTSYSPKIEDPLIVGSCSSSSSDLVALTNKKSIVNIGFDRFLELVEEAVGKRLEKISDNCISQDPSIGDICRYCDIKKCDRRLS